MFRDFFRIKETVSAGVAARRQEKRRFQCDSNIPPKDPKLAPPTLTAKQTALPIVSVGTIAFALLGLLITLLAAPAALAQTVTDPVQVSLVEWAIEMPQTVPAGPTVFEVTNNGTMAHNFKIEGDGLEAAFEENLQPGETRTLKVELQPGEYEVYCPVGNHADRGMWLMLGVVGAGEMTPTDEMTATGEMTATDAFNEIGVVTTTEVDLSAGPYLVSIPMDDQPERSVAGIVMVLGEDE